ncbi:MAG: hypothetical protein HQL31_07765, partial [Planctomycetes bacterium]|nr:hypothetical protein [Planctomycetota bacterium]
KALNKPGFDPHSKAVLREKEKYASWFSFKDSFREVREELSRGGNIVFYGEGTRMPVDRMGQISQRFLTRLEDIPEIKFIPVGTYIRGRRQTVSYGPPCPVAELYRTIAGLSEITLPVDA